MRCEVAELAEHPCAALEEEDIPEISIEMYLLDKLKVRIQLARQIDNAQHKIKKENHEKNWLREAAEAMEIEVDSDMGLRYDDSLIKSCQIFIFHCTSCSSDDEATTKRRKKTMNAKTASLKAELKQLLAQPLIARGISTRYITSGSRPIVDNMIVGDCTCCIFVRVHYSSVETDFFRRRS